MDPKAAQYVHTSTPRPPPVPIRKPSAGLQQAYPNAIGLNLDLTQSNILHESPIAHTSLPQRAAKRKRGDRQNHNTLYDEKQTDQIIITQTVLSDSSEDTLTQAGFPKPALPLNPPSLGPPTPVVSDTITPGENVLSPARSILSDSVRSQIAELSMMNPNSSPPSQQGELSKLIAALTHIGPIGQTTPPASEAKLDTGPGSNPPGPPMAQEDLVDLSTHLSHMDLGLQQYQQLSTKPSAVWPSASKATASWFDEMVVNHALDNSLITSTQKNPQSDLNKKVKISGNLLSDDNLRILRDFHHDQDAPTNVRSFFLSHNRKNANRRTTRPTPSWISPTFWKKNGAGLDLA